MDVSDSIAASIEERMYETKTWAALKSRFNEISKNVSKFIRCTTKIESLRKSGTAERDALVKAQELYRTETIIAFQYQACYGEPRNFPKFQRLLVETEEAQVVGRQLDHDLWC
ncbi:hypothetical protein PI124_g22775 [Phytophthora idaei]|nr:hypothetical protein PI125_g1212 [Phytophthora idaei]KAG3130653.1 hypothetical protein PI126_g20408 [Phytophthora idaei]KAG3232137.1 hypothetical protein PI124_g22775 [Phytophthora idaei]